MNLLTKTTLVILSLWLCTAVFAETKTTEIKQEGNTKITKTTTQKEYDYNPLYNLGRGATNLGTSPLEIPRCMVYDNAKVPVLGLFGGVIEGAFVTVWRLLGGTFDILSLGFSGKGIYSDSFPEFIWDSKWLPKNATVVVEKTIEKK